MNFPGKLAAALVSFALSAQVQAVEFSFLSTSPSSTPGGPSFAATVDGLTLTATGWSTTGKRGRLQSAAVQVHEGVGLGVCNRHEGPHCGLRGKALTLDNKGADDLVLFTFSSPVRLESLRFLQWGGDSDFSLWAGSGPVSLDGMKTRALGTATVVSNRDRRNTIRSLELGRPFDGSYDWFAVAARIGQNNDFSTLHGLVVTPVIQPVPEAGTWAMMLAGLGLVGFARRRRA